MKHPIIRSIYVGLVCLYAYVGSWSDVMICGIISICIELLTWLEHWMDRQRREAMAELESLIAEHERLRAQAKSNLDEQMRKIYGGTW